MQIDRARRKSRAMNLTPLIDVVFLLIVFFMLTTSFIKIDSIELNLPPLPEKAKSKLNSIINPATKPSLDKLMVIAVASTGSIYINNLRIDQMQAETAIKQKIGGRKDQQVLIRVAARVPVQKLVTVMDMVHIAGSRDVSVAEWDGYIPEEVIAIPTEIELGIGTPSNARRTRKAQSQNDAKALETLDGLLNQLERRAP